MKVRVGAGLGSGAGLNKGCCVIHVENLVKTFGDVTAVAGVSFDVASRRNLRLPRPQRRGQDHHDPDAHDAAPAHLRRPSPSTASTRSASTLEVRRRFGIVFQDPSLDGDLTAYENMELHGVLYKVPREARARAHRGRCSRSSACGKRRASKVKKFSGGMKRRLEIARGLLHTPKILFLDEPTLGLDPQTRNQLWTHVSI